MAERQVDISVSIINTNNREVALACLESVYAQAGELALQVIVVNNACRDGSREAIGARFPQVELIEQAEMRGFSTNNNLALAQARGRYWMLLNDDTLVQPGAFQAMAVFMDEHLQAGVAGARLLNRDGSDQPCYGFSPNPLYEGLQPFSEYLVRKPKSKGQPLETGWVHGACLMARASAAGQVGLLDTRFDPLYSEEIDWCYRFRKAGWQIFHLPSARVIHLGEVAARSVSVERYERIFAKKAVFFRKHFGEGTTRVYKASLYFANLLKAGLWLLAWVLGKPEARQEFRVHWNIVRRVKSF